MDEKIISLYARGMSTRDIQDQLKDLYHVDVSATLISNVTNEVIDAVKSWQSRPLDKIYPIVYMDALVIKVQQDKRVINKAFYLALGVNTEGQKELLGIWISENEGAKFWLNVLTEIKNRGVSDILFLASTVLPDFQKPLKQYFQKQKCNCVSCIWCVIRCVMWAGRNAKQWLLICVQFTLLTRLMALSLL